MMAFETAAPNAGKEVVIGTINQFYLLKDLVRKKN
jgi:hypothetical protein